MIHRSECAQARERLTNALDAYKAKVEFSIKTAAYWRQEDARNDKILVVLCAMFATVLLAIRLIPFL